MAGAALGSMMWGPILWWWSGERLVAKNDIASASFWRLVTEVPFGSRSIFVPLQSFPSCIYRIIYRQLLFRLNLSFHDFNEYYLVMVIRHSMFSAFGPMTVKKDERNKMRWNSDDRLLSLQESFISLWNFQLQGLDSASWILDELIFN